MKRSIVVGLLCLLCALGLQAQTAVTLQVTDADSLAWANGTYAIYAALAIQNSPLSAASVTGSLSASGGASMTLTTGATFTFKVCSQASSFGAGVLGNEAVPCYSQSVLMAGSTQTVTLAPTGLRLTWHAGANVRAYADVEMTNTDVGANYFNLTSLVQREWNGTTWRDVGNAPVVPVASLGTCAAGNEGQRKSVTDASATTFNSTVAGSGSNHMGVRCNATNWVID